VLTGNTGSAPTFQALSSAEPLGQLTAVTNPPIPTNITDMANNGTTWVGVSSTKSLYHNRSYESREMGWECFARRISLHHVSSGVGFVGVTASVPINQVWISSDGTNWTNQTAILPFSPACIRTDGTTLVVCGTSVSYPASATAAGQIWTSTDGTTWTQRTSNAGANNLNWLSYNATSGVWWCCGAAGTLLSATTPTGTWTSRTSNTAIALVRVEQTPDGTTGAVAISSDGSLIYTTAPERLGRHGLK